MLSPASILWRAAQSSVINYSFLDRLLHRAALQCRPIAELSFDLDQAKNRFDPLEIKGGRHVFVTGLARAGTTILMRRVYSSGAFCSLTYRNMPFVLAPNVWSRFTQDAKRNDPPAERAHGDRILVDFDSPESFDEVFWRVFDGEGYIAKTYLKPHEPDDETVEKYVAYIAAILKADRKKRGRYLSKNNNNILRLGVIARTFPAAVILVPFRDPLAHAGSLLRQHRNFVAQQKKNPFIRSYMTWLGHHEFGLDHRRFQWEGVAAERWPGSSPDELDYWLQVWTEAYTWLEKTAPKGAIFVCYEDLCADPHVWDRLAGICGIENPDAGDEPFTISENSARAPAGAAHIIDKAAATYDRLIKRGRASL